MISKINKPVETWLITGVAGFIGSNLLEALLKSGKKVVGLDNFLTGRLQNLDEIRTLVREEQWENFRFIEGDICNLEVCHQACKGVDYVLHQAALGSVPRSIENPIATHLVNSDGFLNMITAARDARVKRFVYASSSSVYGDNLELPKIEEKVGMPLSPYAVTKYTNELYADVFARCYQLEVIGLRYFNVFGARQDPDGAYAAVIPKWIRAMIRGDIVNVNGDGSTSRDFCYIENVIQANLLAAIVQTPGAINQVYNIASGGRISLNELFECLREKLAPCFPHLKKIKPIYGEFRPGDIQHSLADISKSKILLGYQPSHDIYAGLTDSVDWYIKNTDKSL